MDYNIQKLYNEFVKIRSKGYIPSFYNYMNAAGMTFEKLLGKERDELFWPDYEGIEIKTKKGYSKSKTTLFAANPDGKYVLALQTLFEEFGKSANGIKTLMLEVNAKEYIYYNKNKFILFVDRYNRYINLKIYNYKNELINDDVIWSFNLLEERINYKLKILALVKYCTKIINQKENYWYYKIIFYKDFSFEKFLKQIEIGNITIRIGVGIFKSGKRAGQIHNHGVDFSIEEKYLDNIYDKVIMF